MTVSATASAGRPFNRWLLIPPFPGSTRFQEDTPARDLAWRNITLYAEIRERGRRLFSGLLQQRNARWQEFRNYIRQAKTYDDAARLVAGSSAALLYYYAMLNLAKAELLVHPGLSLGPREYHGLAYNPGRARSIKGDELTVRNGIFPRLYEKRVGNSLPQGTRLPIIRLLSNVPEIGWELDTLGIGEAKVCPIIHAIVSDGQESWSVVGTWDPRMLRDQGATGRLFRRHYVEITKPNNWQDIFAITRRYISGDFTFFEARARYTSPLPASGQITSPIVISVINGVGNNLRGILEEPSYEGFDALICSSLYKTRMLAMPASLARYALMFYVSSLVRYKPSQLDPVNRASQAWLLDSFTDQAAPFLLRAALSGIERHAVLFYSQDSFRL